MILTRNIAAFFYAFTLLVSGPLTAQAENVGEYGKAGVEVDRSVLRELENYQPPPMFTAPPSERVVIPPPEQQQLTAPTSEKLLSHPVENHHVFTLQKSGNAKDLNSLPLIPLPESDPQPAANSKVEGPPPIPPKKPVAMPKNGVEASKPAVKTISQKEEIREDEPKSVSAATTPAYKPSAPKTMPAVPPVKVESKPIPGLSNLPPIEPEKIEKPSIGERMMDDALTRHMVKDEDAVREVMGIPAGKQSDAPQADMSRFSMAFETGKADLAQDQKILIDQNVIPKLLSDASARLQIRAYASRTDGTESSSRRISLSRALAARSYLLEKGIQPTRIDVRALSDNTAEPPTDRIDMSFIEVK